MERQDEDMKKLLSLLEELTEQRIIQEREMYTLLQKSESRLDLAVKEMTKASSNCMSVCQKLTETYSHHLDALCANRDASMKQVEQLTSLLVRMEDDLRVERNRNNEVIRQVINNSGRNGTEINVK